MSDAEQDLLARLARQLAAENDTGSVLQRVVQASVLQVEGAEHAGITVLSRHSVSTPAATDELVQQVDKVQYSVGEGPCLYAAMRHRPVVRADDLRVDRRWPAFAAGVLELGVRSMLSFQLYTERDTIGALNLYAGAAYAFTQSSAHIGSLLATHAAVAIAAARQSGNLRLALETRDVIGQAKGILMERYKVTADQAFDLLIAASQHTQRKLAEVAAGLAATGELAPD